MITARILQQVCDLKRQSLLGNSRVEQQHLCYLLHGQIALRTHVAPAGGTMVQPRKAIRAHEMAFDTLFDWRSNMVQTDGTLQERQHLLVVHLGHVHDVRLKPLETNAQSIISLNSNKLHLLTFRAACQLHGDQMFRDGKFFLSLKGFSLEIRHLDGATSGTPKESLRKQARIRHLAAFLNYISLRSHDLLRSANPMPVY